MRIHLRFKRTEAVLVSGARRPHWECDDPALLGQLNERMPRWIASICAAYEGDMTIAEKAADELVGDIVRVEPGPEPKGGDAPLPPGTVL